MAYGQNKWAVNYGTMKSTGTWCSMAFTVGQKYHYSYPQRLWHGEQTSVEDVMTFDPFLARLLPHSHPTLVILPIKGPLFSPVVVLTFNCPQLDFQVNWSSSRPSHSQQSPDQGVKLVHRPLVHQGSFLPFRSLETLLPSSQSTVRSI